MPSDPAGEIARLRKAAEVRFRRAVAAADASRRRELALLDRMAERWGVGRPGAKGTTAMVAEVVEQMAGEFDVMALLAAVDQRHPAAGVTREAVQRAIFYLRSRGTIAVVKPGHQRRSGVYRRAVAD